MFGFRPDLTPRDVDVDGPASVPGFRVTDTGFHVSDPLLGPHSDGASGRAQSFIPVKWDAGNTADGASVPSFWEDAQDAAKWIGRGANAIVDGAYSIFPGTGNFLRESGRGLGFYGPEEAHRFGQEASAIGQGLGFIAHHPVQAANLARDGMTDAIKAQPLLPLYAAGRLGMGALLMSHWIPLAPLAALGDGWREVENGHNLIDAIGRGIVGPGPGGR